MGKLLFISLAFNALLFVSVVVLIAMHKYRSHRYREMRDFTNFPTDNNYNL